MDTFETMEKVQQLLDDGYKLAAQGTFDGRTEQNSITPYSGEYGTGYIVKRNFFGLVTEYSFYEIYTKDEG
jgi:hypothetical protein